MTLLDSIAEELRSLSRQERPDRYVVFINHKHSKQLRKESKLQSSPNIWIGRIHETTRTSDTLSHGDVLQVDRTIFGWFVLDPTTDCVRVLDSEGVSPIGIISGV